MVLKQGEVQNSWLWLALPRLDDIDLKIVDCISSMSWS